MEELLGPVSIWRDIRLQANEDFPESIQTALSDTGVVLAIVSPNFLRSKYCCEQEIPHFEKNIGSAGWKVGNLYRVIKVIRRPSLEDRHELWLPDALGVPFWKSDKQSGSVQEFRGGTKPFKDSVARVAQAVAQTLIDLRNAHLPVYIAKPSTDLDKSFEGLRKELHAWGYRVLPGAESGRRRPFRSKWRERHYPSICWARNLIHSFPGKPNLPAIARSQCFFGLARMRDRSTPSW